MTSLVIAEHDNTSIKAATLNTIAAAAQCGGDVHVLVAGKGCKGVADAAAKLAGVAKVLIADGDAYAHSLAEPIAALDTQGRIHHAGIFGALEDQLCRFMAGVKDSPDRADARTWALTELMLNKPQGEGPRVWGG